MRRPGLARHRALQDFTRPHSRAAACAEYRRAKTLGIRGIVFAPPLKDGPRGAVPKVRMSKFISVYHRGAFDASRAEAKIARILREITPDNLRDSSRHAVGRAGNHLQGTLNLPAHSPRHGLGLVQGKLYGPAEGWWRPGGPVPDGSFAMLREDEASFEAVTDATASRTIWVYFDPEILAVSNSQRALTILSGRFGFNRAVVPWMIADGQIGSGNSYSQFLRPLPPATVLTLDKAAWSLRERHAPIGFAPVERSRDEHRAALEAAIRGTLASFDATDAERSIVSLSGGYDSRGIVCMLPPLAAGRRWQTFTGGPAGSIEMPGSDSAIGNEVARSMGTAHRFLPRPDPSEPADAVFARFLRQSEGRTDHIRGYVDGFATLKMLFEEGRRFYIRGDVSLGWKKTAPSEAAVRGSMELVFCHEIANLAPHVEAFGLAEQRLPDRLLRAPEESLETWRDRLYYEYRIPTVLGALTETKTAYGDILNPLLSRRVLEVAHGLPDVLRTDKALFRELVAEVGPDLPVARTNGALDLRGLMGRPEIRRLLADSLGSETARDCFGAPMIAWTRRELARADRFHVRALHRLRRDIDTRLRGKPPAPSLHPVTIALRMLVVIATVDQFAADAALGRALDRSSAEPMVA
jgi:hypothetical protein